jgi:hypothetical protein
MKGDRVEVKKNKENISNEGNFEGKNKYKDDLKKIRYERDDVKKKKDNMRKEGEFKGSKK